MTKALLNASGHALSDVAMTSLNEMFDRIETLDVGLIDFSEPVDTQIASIFSTADTPLDGSISITVILPGHPTVAVLAFVFLHGALGYFPNICVLEQSPDGPFSPTTLFSIDTRNIRIGGREMRQRFMQEHIAHRDDDDE